MELIIIRGLPGSGKSTRARTEYPDHLHYEPDHLFSDTQGRYRFDAQLWGEACQWVVMMTDFALARGESVVVSDVFATDKEVAPYRELARHHGADFKVVNCDMDLQSSHHVPLTIIRRMVEAWEMVQF